MNAHLMSRTLHAFFSGSALHANPAKRQLKAGSLFTLITACLISAQSLAFEPIDGIRIIVDSEVITESQFQTRLAETRDSVSGKNIPEEVIIERVQDQLIIEALQLRIAKRNGIFISEQELTFTLENIAKRNNLTLPELKAQIEADGDSYTAFRQRIRQDLMIQHVQRGHLRSKVNVTDDEVDAYLASPAGKKLTEEAYDVSFITLPLDNPSKADIKQAKAALNQLKTAVSGNKESFESFVRGKTWQGYKLSGTQLGKRNKADLPSLIADLVNKLDQGQVSKPVKSGAGLHLIKMNQKIGGTQLEYQVHARHILISPSAIRTDEQTANLAKEIHERLASGGNFSLLAKEYSGDSGSALQGGDLGWSSPKRYVPEFISALKNLNKGDVSQPIKSQFGWHIIEKIDERDHDITNENQRNQARNILGQRAYNEELESWIQEIKGEAFIEIKAQG